VKIGNSAPVTVQSMCNTDTRDAARTLGQISDLEQAGCEIVRLAVPDEDAARALGKIRKGTRMPLIADIHFDHRLALESITQGVDGLRINPGNIGGKGKVSEVVRACKDKGIPIRIGVNAGSLEKHLLEKYQHPTPEAIVESALGHIRILEDLNFTNLKVSLKASDVMTTVASYRLFSEKSDYPLHIGISEAGTLFSGTIKSSVGLGILLAEGIGDTMRVSLTADPVEEVRVAYGIIKSLKIRQRGVNIISCPTCGRTEIYIIGLAQEVEKRLAARGWGVVNVDATIIAQAPRLAPYLPQMIDRLAAAMRVTPDRVNLKATTTEKLGFTGRGEGIAAQAVALLGPLEQS
jgi:(E)-4-hydroxy-3-methylbut-2-enyl-diphosphate synthase